jgi:DHA1 family quinolone resistance protein-like MFS transporter
MVATSIYIIPALADMIIAQFIFINTVRLALTGASASVVANTVTTWSIVYLVSCLALGRVVNAANAARLMMVSMGMLAMIGLMFTLVPGVAWVYGLMALAGVAAALFFVPFQVFMKAVDGVDSKPLTYSTGLYTFAWSMGFAVGPFVSGFLMEMGTVLPGGETSGWKYACYFAVGAALLSGTAIYLLKHLVQRQPQVASPDTAAAVKPAADYSRQPDLAWLGWVSGGVGVVLITFVRAVFPVRAEAGLHLARSTQGMLFFLVSLSQALTGLLLCRSRYWMYRPRAVAAFGVVGILGALAFGFARVPAALALGAVLFGIYAGSFFFYLVFHALVHPQRSSQYVAINESVVGVCSMLGAMIGGWVADRYGFGMLYAAGAATILMTLGLQWAIHSRHPRI